MAPPITAVPGGYKCPYCPVQFATVRGIRIHCSFRHKDQPAPGLAPGERPRAAKTTRKKRRAKSRRASPRPGSRPAPTPALAPVPMAVNFCPHCGADLALIARAMAIAVQVKEHRNNG